MAGRLGNEEPLHRAGLALGEWLLRVLQRKTQGRVPQWRNLLQLEGGPNHHRKLAQSLQHQAPTLCAWLSPAGTARDRTKARPSGHHELISQCVWYKKSVRPIERSLRGLFHHSLDKWLLSNLGQFNAVEAIPHGLQGGPHSVQDVWGCFRGQIPANCAPGMLRLSISD